MLFGLIKIDKSEPKIVNVEKPIIASGFFVNTSTSKIFADLPKLYSQYMSYKDKNGIPNQKLPWEYISLSKNFDDKNKTWDYYTGHVVTDFDKNNKDLTNFEAPAGTYAVFKIEAKGKIRFGITMAQTKEYIYNKWLPASKYQFDGYEFEYNNEEMAKENPYFINLYVGIKEKNK